ncbi:hypothetical protein PJJ89_28995, partial [Mycobacterium kansasii]
MKEEQRLLTRSMDSVEEVLEKADAPLNSSNLNTYIETTSKIQKGKSEGMSLGSIIGTRKAFYIYDLNHKLLYSTNRHTFGFQNQA